MRLSQYSKVGVVQKVCELIKEQNSKQTLPNFIEIKEKIHFFTTENPETKASIVERFQRTLKSCMWKYFTHHRTLRYVDILSKLVEGYNHAYHRSIKRAPVSVTPKNEPQVSEILFGKSKLSKQQPKFKVGDYVRINKTKHTF